MRGFERVGYLFRDRQRLVERNCPARDPLRQVLTFDELEDERRDAVGLFEAVNVRDVRMVQRGEDLRFTTEAHQAIGIIRDRGQEDFNRDVAIQLRVARLVDLAHPACTEGGEDFVGPEAGAGCQSHVRRILARAGANASVRLRADLGHDSHVGGVRLGRSADGAGTR